MSLAAGEPNLDAPVLSAPELSAIIDRLGMGITHDIVMKILEKASHAGYCHIVQRMLDSFDGDFDISDIAAAVRSAVDGGQREVTRLLLGFRICYGYDSDGEIVDDVFTSLFEDYPDLLREVLSMCRDDIDYNTVDDLLLRISWGRCASASATRIVFESVGDRITVGTVRKCGGGMFADGLELDRDEFRAAIARCLDDDTLLVDLLPELRSLLNSLLNSDDLGPKSAAKLS